MKRTFLVFIPLLFLLCVATGAHAQIQSPAIGPKLGLYFNNSLFMLGAISEIPLTAALDFEPGVELVLGVSHTTRVVVDANGRYSFTLQGNDLRPFVMAGLGVVTDFVSVGGTSDSKTDLRVNLGGGVVFNSRSLTQYWGGLKISVLSDDNSDVLLQAGVNFYL
jgi:hypothetical protein